MDQTPQSPDGRDDTAAGRRFHVPGHEVAGVIGRGAFGVVYRAREAAFDREVAIKVLTVPIDEDDHGRFERECRSVGLVSGHPNIVTVHASGRDEMERPYLVMEFIEGGSLAERLEREGPVGWGKATEIGVKLAGALETAHRAGILHRDVKPENVLVSAYGEPKLADFGISRIHGSRQTRSGLVTATPLYAAPEVLNGQRATVASDVYSLGATMFALLTGAAAFQRDDDETLFALVYRVSTEPLPDLRGDGVPDEICLVVESAMSKEPAARPATAADFGEALRDAQRRLGWPPTEMRVTVDRNATVPRQPSDATPPPPSAVPTTAPAATPRAPDGGPPPAPPGDIERRRPHSRRRFAAGAVGSAVLVAAVVVGLNAVGRRGPAVIRTAATTSTSLPRGAATIERRFATSRADGVESSRTWALEPGDGVLRNVLTILNTTAAEKRVGHYEVVPKGAAASVDRITFDPQPAEVVRADPVVRFDVTLGPGATRELRWQVVLPPEARNDGALGALAEARDSADSAFRAELAAIPAAPDAPPVLPPTLGSTATDPEWAAGPGGPGGGSGPAVPDPGDPEDSTGTSSTTTASSTTSTEPTTTTGRPVVAPGPVASLTVRDPVAAEVSDGVPQRIRVTLQWADPGDDGGSALTRYRVRCTLMQNNQVYNGPAEPSPCRGGIEVATPSSTAAATTVTISRSQDARTWVRWEIAAENSAGVGPYTGAQVVVPQLVGLYSWEAYPMARTVGLNAGGDTPRDCGRESSQICAQSAAAGSTRANGADVFLGEQS